MAAHFGASVPTVRIALHALVELGLVEIRRGSGTFVAPSRSGGRVLNVAIRKADRAEATWILRQLEVEGARRAAQRAKSAAATPHHESLNMLALERDRLRSSWPDDFVAADMDFHRAVIGAGGMTLATQLHRRIAGRARPGLLRSAIECAEDEALSRLHHRLAIAVAAGRVPEAERVAARIAASEGALPSSHAADTPSRRTGRLRAARPPPR